jgi:hypothetical protein
MYVPIEVNSPITVKRNINIQKGLTNNFPEIVFEIHDCCRYFDLGDECTLSAAVTNSYLESVKFSGDLSLFNPHRGQILCKLNYEDFTETGINTLTVKCVCKDKTISFQTTIFVQSVSSGLADILGKD